MKKFEVTQAHIKNTKNTVLSDSSLAAAKQAMRGVYPSTSKYFIWTETPEVSTGIDGERVECFAYTYVSKFGTETCTVEVREILAPKATIFANPTYAK